MTLRATPDDEPFLDDPEDFLREEDADDPDFAEEDEAPEPDRDDDPTRTEAA